MVRKFYSSLFVLVVLFVLVGTATASSITFIETPGSYTITNVNWNNGSVAVVGNYANGDAFAFQNGVFTNLDMGDFARVGVAGVAGNYVLAAGLNSDFFTWKTLVYALGSGSVVNPNVGLDWEGVGNNGQFAGIGSDGKAVVGYINASGQVVPTGGVSLIGAENISEAHAVHNNVVAGLTSVNGDSLKAFLSINGVRQPLDAGFSSVALGIDAATDLPFGERNGKAVWAWDALGNYHEVPAVGGGTIDGEVTSGFGGLFTVKDSKGDLWITNGTTTMSFADYLIQLGIAADPSQTAFFLGEGSQAAFVFENSIALAEGPTTAFSSALDPTPVATPEPSSWALLGTGLCLCLFVSSRRLARR